MSRREQIFNDDFVGVFLDTFNDRQRAYLFAASPLGIQLDGIISEGQEDDFSFDTIWQSRGRLTEFGYVVSIAIPFKSLRFPPASGPRTWGVNSCEGFPGKSETPSGGRNERLAPSRRSSRTAPAEGVSPRPHSTHSVRDVHRGPLRIAGAALRHRKRRACGRRRRCRAGFVAVASH